MPKNMTNPKRALLRAKTTPIAKAAPPAKTDAGLLALIAEYDKANVDYHQQLKQVQKLEMQAHLLSPAPPWTAAMRWLNDAIDNAFRADAGRMSDSLNGAVHALRDELNKAFRERFDAASAEERKVNLADARREFAARRDKVRRLRSSILDIKPVTDEGARAQLEMICLGSLVDAGAIGEIERTALFGVLNQLRR